MSDKYVPWLAAVGAFAAALLLGAFVADALRSEQLPVELPGTLGDPIPVISGVDVTGHAGVEPQGDGLFRQTRIAAEFVTIEDGRVPADGTGGGGDPSFGDGGDEDPPGAGTGPPAAAGDGSSGSGPSPDPGFEPELLNLEFSLIDLLGDESLWPLLRFLDYCADNPEDPDCPQGVGGTVLRPLSDGGIGDAGVFDLSGTLYSARGGFWRCEAPDGISRNQYNLMLLATHPARIEITYYPNDDPADVTTVVSDTTDLLDPEWVRFVDTVGRNGGPVTGGDRVQHCFVLDGDLQARSYTIEAVATSFTTEIDSETFTFGTTEQRGRPPVVIAPLSDYQATVVVPVQGDSGQQTSIVRLIRPEEGLRCTDIERAVLAGERTDVIDRPDSGFALWSEYAGRERIGDEIISRSDWFYDPAFDTYQFWTLRLQEGRHYLVCIWWVDSPERSFDSATVAERESRWLSTPDRLSTTILLDSIGSSSRAGLSPESVVVSAPCGRSSLLPPTGDFYDPAGLDRNEATSLSPRPVLCNYNGYEQPPVTMVTVRLADGTQQVFAVNTPNIGVPRQESILLNLATERTTGLCGSSFGSCDPPTEIVPGPQVVLLVRFDQGETSPLDDWRRGSPAAFEGAVVIPEELPEKIRLDHFNSFIEPDGREAVGVTANFDRPVQLQAFLEGAPADYCLTGEAPTFGSTGFRASYSFSLGGLCTLSPYAVELVATDEAGTTTSFVNNVREGLDWTIWRGFSGTDGFRVAYFVRTASRLTGDIFTRNASVRVDSHSEDMTTINGCWTSTQSTEINDMWGEVVEVSISIALSDGRRRDGECEFRRDAPSWEGSAVATFTIEDFMSGPIEIDVPLVPASRFDGTPTVRITLIGRVVG